MPPVSENIAATEMIASQQLQKLDTLDYSPSKWPLVKERLRQMPCFSDELTDYVYHVNVPPEFDRVMHHFNDSFGVDMRRWRLSPNSSEKNQYKTCLSAFLDEITQLQKLPKAAAETMGRIIGSLIKHGAVSDALSYVLKLMLNDWLREIGSAASVATLYALRELGAEYFRNDPMFVYRLLNSPGCPFLPPDVSAFINNAAAEQQQHQQQQPVVMKPTADAGHASNLTTRPVVMNGVHPETAPQQQPPTTVVTTAASTTVPSSSTTTTATIALTSLFDKLATRNNNKPATTAAAAAAHATEYKKHVTEYKKANGGNNSNNLPHENNADIQYTADWLLPLDVLLDQTTDSGGDYRKNIELEKFIHKKIDVSDPSNGAVDKISFMFNQLNDMSIQYHAAHIMTVCREESEHRYDGQLGEVILWLAWYVTLARARVEENYHDLYLSVLVKLSTTGLRTILPACANMCAYFIVLALDLPHEMQRPRLELKPDITKMGHFLGLIVAHRKSNTSIPAFLEPRRLVETMRQLLSGRNGTLVVPNGVENGAVNDNNNGGNNRPVANGDVAANGISTTSTRDVVKLTDTVLAVACAMLMKAVTTMSDSSNKQQHGAAAKNYGNNVNNATPYVLRQLAYLRQYHDVCHENARFEIERLFEALRIPLNDAKIKQLVEEDKNNNNKNAVAVITATDLPQPTTKTPSPPRAVNTGGDHSKLATLTLPNGVGRKELQQQHPQVLSPAEFDDGVFAPSQTTTSRSVIGGAQSVAASLPGLSTSNSVSDIYVAQSSGNNNSTADLLSWETAGASAAAADDVVSPSSFADRHFGAATANVSSLSPASSTVVTTTAHQSTPVMDPAVLSSGSRDQTPTASSVSGFGGGVNVSSGKSKLELEDPSIMDLSDMNLRQQPTTTTTTTGTVVIAPKPTEKRPTIAPIAPPGGGGGGGAVGGGASGDYIQQQRATPDQLAAAHDLELQQRNMPKLEEKLLQLGSDVDGGSGDDGVVGDDAIVVNDDVGNSVGGGGSLVAGGAGASGQRRLPVFLPNNDIWWMPNELRSIAPLLSPVQRTMPFFRVELDMNVPQGSGIDEQFLQNMLVPLLESHCKNFEPLQRLCKMLEPFNVVHYIVTHAMQKARNDTDLFIARVPPIVAPTMAVLTCKDFAFDVDPMRMQKNAEMAARYAASGLIDCMFRAKLRTPLADLFVTLVVRQMYAKFLTADQRMSMPADTLTELEGYSKYMADECGGIVVQYILYKTIRYAVRELQVQPLLGAEIMQRRNLVAACGNDMCAAAGAHLAGRMEQFHDVNRRLPLRLRYRLDGMPPPELTGPYNVIRRRVHGFVNNIDFVTRQQVE